MTPESFLTLLFVLFIFGALVTIAIVRALLHSKAANSHEHDIVRISIPQYASGQGNDRDQQKSQIKERLAQVESLFTAMATLRAERGIRAFFYGRSDHFSLEIVSDGELVSFYAALPKNLTSFFVQQVHSVYPQANFETITDYNIFQPRASILGGYLTFRRAFVLPIKTYRSLENDPLELLTTALGKIPKNGGAGIQFVIRSAKKSWRTPGRKIVKDVTHGSSIAQALRSAGNSNSGAVVWTILRQAISIVTSSFASSKPKQQTSLPHSQTQPSQADLEMLKVIEEKMNKPAFDVTIRVVVSTPDRQQTEIHLRNIMNAFGQYNSYEFGNSLQPSYTNNQESIIRKFIYREMEPRAFCVLNAEEMVSMFHLPERVQTPNVRWLKAKKVAPPSSLSQEGIILGRTTYRNEQLDIRIKDNDRRRHVYIIGQTGTGKSVLMQNMAIQDIQRGKGICVIDPHGDLVDVILSHIPKERVDDVIIFDPSDTERPLAINMLEFNTPDQKTFVINEMINIFDKLYDLRQTGGPMFEQYMRNAMLLMMEDPESGSTLLEIPKVLADAKFRKYKLSKTQNPVVKDFWEKEAEKAGGEAALANMVPYITSKLTQFVANDIMRPIISQQKSSFDFRMVMDEQKILLINLSKGKIGDMNSMLLGMVFVGKILMAALSRVDVDETKRNDFYLYIDEFQNFITDSIAIILSEARKYRLNLTMAHQYIGQLVKNNNTSVRDAVFGNVGTIAAFRVGVEDAELIAKQFAPVVDTYDVMNVEKFNFYLRLLVDNQNPPAFSCASIKPEPGDPNTVVTLKERSRMNYGRPRDIIEKEIFDRTKVPVIAPPPLPPIQ